MTRGPGSEAQVQPGVGHAPTDEDLMLAAGRGSEAAVGELYQRHAAQMYGLAMTISRDPALSEDIVQEAMVGIWRFAPRFDPGRGSARTWMLSITHHRAIDAVRRRRPTGDLPLPETAPPPQLVGPDPWADVVARADASRVRAALSRLSDVQREAIELAYFGGLTQQEIAVRTDTPLGTVKSRIRLGLLTLRSELEAIGRGEVGQR